MVCEEPASSKPGKANSKLNFHVLECVKDVNEGKVSRSGAILIVQLLAPCSPLPPLLPCTHHPTQKGWGGGGTALQH